MEQQELVWRVWVRNKSVIVSGYKKGAAHVFTQDRIFILWPWTDPARKIRKLKREIQADANLIIPENTAENRVGGG